MGKNTNIFSHNSKDLTQHFYETELTEAYFTQKSVSLKIEIDLRTELTISYTTFRRGNLNLTCLRLLRIWLLFLNIK